MFARPASVRPRRHVWSILVGPIFAVSGFFARTLGACRNDARLIPPRNAVIERDADRLAPPAMRILITGVTGQLGGKLKDACSRRASAILCPDRAELDLATGESIARAFAAAAADVVVNCAAYTKVDEAEGERDLAFAVNETAPALLAELCAARRIPLIQVSTDYVLDGAKSSPYRPDDTVGPLNVYGASKEAGERAVRDRLDRHLILRTSWLYSDTGHNFLRTMLELGALQDEIAVVADQCGSPSSAEDVAEAIGAILLRLARGEELPWGTYHVANEGATTWHGFAEAIFQCSAAMTGRRPRVRPIATGDYPARARRPANSALDCASSKAALGLTLRPWEDAVRDVIGALRSGSTR
jgi:dTDP-4-dehydrorhamnose reductase